MTNTAPLASFTMPNLTGMYWQDAYPALQSVGWTGMLNKLADVRGSDLPPSVIATQDPEPGKPVHSNQTITLAFAAK